MTPAELGIAAAILDDQERDTTYNGWANYETWNVSLWIQNDEGLYDIAREAARGTIHPYGDFVDVMLMLGSKDTPDGVSWSHPDLDFDELNEMMEELVS